MRLTKANLSSHRAKQAYTLIEMLLVASLLSVTGLAVYHAIANGIRVWEYSKRYSAQEEVAVFLEKISQDLQNTYSNSLIRFEGKPEKIFIPTIVRVPADKYAPERGQVIEQPGAVDYFIQKGKKTIYRRVNNYSQCLHPKRKSAAVAVATHVENMRLTYGVIDDESIKIKKTISHEIPAAVQVDVDFVEVGGRIRHVKRVINIPMGTLHEKNLLR